MLFCMICSLQMLFSLLDCLQHCSADLNLELGHALPTPLPRWVDACWGVCSCFAGKNGASNHNGGRLCSFWWFYPCLDMGLRG